jgi:outer membrane protein
LPSLSVAYGYFRSSEARLDQTGQSFATGGYGAEVSVSYDPIASLVATATLGASDHALEASAAGIIEARARTVLKVKEAFFRALASREVVALETDRLQRQVTQSEFVTASIEHGRTTRVELLRSEVDRNNASMAVARARLELVASAETLGAVIGVAFAMYPEPSRRLGASALAYSRDEILAKVRDTSPQLRRDRWQIAALENQMLRARLTYLPSLTITAAMSWQSAEFPPNERSWRVQAMGVYPIFDGFRRSEENAKASAALRAASAAAREVELTLLSNVSAEYDHVALAIQAKHIAEETEALSREELLLHEELFRVGRASIIELQSAQITARQAALDGLRARLDYDLGIARLEAWLGCDTQSCPSDAGAALQQ